MEECKIFADRIASVKRQINAAMERAGREDEITIVGASKTMSRDVVKVFDDNKLLAVLGENRVQELLDKYDINNFIKWHFIGSLQTNKVKQVIGKASLIHSLDRDELAAEIDKRSAAKGIKTHCLVQINMGKELSKSGYMPNETLSTVERLKKYEHIVIDGLMAVMPIAERETLIEIYKNLNSIFTEVKKRYGMQILSAGMTNDYELAVEYAGSNMVRIGRAIFGERYLKNEENKT